MKVISLFSSLIIAISLSACGGAEHESHDGGTHESMTEERVVTDQTPMAASDGDEQVVHITVSEQGYVPNTVRLRADVPARFIFTRHTESRCLEGVQIPDFGVETTSLPMHEPVELVFTPDRAGEFRFVCGMDMMGGTILVEA